MSAISANVRKAPDAVAAAPSFSFISAEQLRAAVLDGSEVAVVDVREGDRYATGHVSVAVELPFSEIELKIAALVPRKATRLIVTDDDGESLGPDAAERLSGFGYSDVHVLEGGVKGWAAKGFELLTGLNSLSKALGEFVERRYHTPKINAKQLQDRLNSNEKFVVLDTRPLAEFNYISIPSGVAAPGAELLYRVFEAVPSPDTPIVVNCAGRTRAIIGAQALLNAGIPNPVVSLENGTSAWLLEGFEPARGVEVEAPRPQREALERARAAASIVAGKFGVRQIDKPTLDKLRANRATSTLYLFDVRTLSEYVAGHVPDSRSAPGGQLVQATDRYIGTRRGHIVLLDDADLVRSTITASWLIQLGLPNVYIYATEKAERTEQGHERPQVPGDFSSAKTISPRELKTLLDANDAIVVDLEAAPPYFIERVYIPGSLAGRRSTLADRLARLEGNKPLVLTSGNGVVAALAASEIAGLTKRKVLALKGGTDAWIAADFPVVQGLDQVSLDPAEALPPIPTLDEKRKTLAAYVSWGDVVTDQLRRDGLVEFKAFD